MCASELRGGRVLSERDCQRAGDKETDRKYMCRLECGWLPARGNCQSLGPVKKVDFQMCPAKPSWRLSLVGLRIYG